VKIIQADDHKLFREGVSSLLNRIDDNIETLECEDFESTEKMIEQHPDCDIVLIDLDMPGMRGLNGLRELVTRYPALPVMVLSASEDRLDVDHALKIGAAGFVPKSSPTDILWSAIRLVMAGGIYSPPTPQHALTSGRAMSGQQRITPRQTEILESVANGLSNNAIAQSLSLSESTVKGHLNAILKVLEVDNRIQAINRAYDLGILTRHHSRSEALNMLRNCAGFNGLVKS